MSFLRNIKLLVGGRYFMPMVKDYLKNNFKRGIEAGILQYGVAQ